MEYNDVLELKKGLDEQDTSEPFLYLDNGDMKVVGDANNTKVRTHDYSLTFESTDGKQVTKEYKKIFIPPRKRLKVQRLLVKMLPYFRSIDAEGNVSKLTDEEALSAVVSMDDEVYDIMYDLAEEVLEVPHELKDFITPASVIAFGIKLVLDNPATAREADQSFG